MASLTTVGYICEEIDPRDVVDQIKNQLIIALINNIHGNPGPDQLEPCRVATKALSISIPFASQNFKVQNERDYIMNKLFEACESSGDEDIIDCSLQSLREISIQEYDSV